MPCLLWPGIVYVPHFWLTCSVFLWSWFGLLVFRWIFQVAATSILCVSFWQCPDGHQTRQKNVTTQYQSDRCIALLLYCTLYELFWQQSRQCSLETLWHMLAGNKALAVLEVCLHAAVMRVMSFSDTCQVCNSVSSLLLQPLPFLMQ